MFEFIRLILTNTYTAVYGKSSTLGYPILFTFSLSCNLLLNLPLFIVILISFHSLVNLLTSNHPSLIDNWQYCGIKIWQSPSFCLSSELPIPFVHPSQLGLIYFRWIVQKNQTIHKHAIWWVTFDQLTYEYIEFSLFTNEIYLSR